MKTNPNDVIISSREERMFPKDQVIPPTADINSFPLITVYTGLTKREYFAAMAMQAFLIKYGSSEESWQSFSAICGVKMADKLIEQLNKEQHD